MWSNINLKLFFYDPVCIYECCSMFNWPHYSYLINFSISIYFLLLVLSKIDSLPIFMVYSLVFVLFSKDQSNFVFVSIICQNNLIRLPLTFDWNKFHQKFIFSLEQLNFPPFRNFWVEVNYIFDDTDEFDFRKEKDFFHIVFLLVRASSFWLNPYSCFFYWVFRHQILKLWCLLTFWP
jgi:hypothetical protein